MIKLIKSVIGILFVGLLMFPAVAKADGGGVTLKGNFQTDALVGQIDSVIGANEYNGPFVSNSYLDLSLASQYVTAGARLELLHCPLPGFEDAFAGGGLPNVYVTGKYKWFEATVGNVYDQFGSGFIFRAYEDRPLGVDNSLRGARIVLTPYKGIRLKALGGMQRKYFNYGMDNAFGFDYSQGAVMGADLELNINEWSKAMQDGGYNLLLGASYVSKYDPEELIQPSPMYKLNLPQFVGAGDVRVRFQKGGWNALVEYAYKANDPSADNGYIYKPGQVAMISLAYSQRGMSFIVQAKRSENMSFRSDRTGSGIGGFINHMPAFSMTHTYALAAMYPYATQYGTAPTESNPHAARGEWAFQAEARYTFKRKTPMGGKYGTSFRLNGTYIRGIKADPVAVNATGTLQGTNGYTSPFFAMGDETYYLDVHLEFAKKITKTFSMTALYMFQQYNQAVVEGHGWNAAEEGFGFKASKPGNIVNSNIAIVELKYKPSKNIGMRGELQYLHTRQDRGQWVYALYEISLFQQAMIEVSDLYNIDATKQHYYKVAASYNWGTHRVQLSYGRTRAGYNCSGGVCRYVPASKGLALSYSVSF
jgi:hypothetical protein